LKICLWNAAQDPTVPLGLTDVPEHQMTAWHQVTVSATFAISPSSRLSVVSSGMMWANSTSSPIRLSETAATLGAAVSMVLAVNAMMLRCSRRLRIRINLYLKSCKLPRASLTKTSPLYGGILPSSQIPLVSPFRVASRAGTMLTARLLR
jgi:hypothetical protein